jgi:RNA polymerase sigma-70 factor (ECF subfamily)
MRKKGRRQMVPLSAPVRSGGGDGGRETSLVDLMEASVDLPGAGLDDQERDDLVQQAISALSPTLREILLLAYFQRLSYAQIADDLEIPLGTVKSRLHAAVAGFARHWKRLSEAHAGAKPGESGETER